MKRGLGIAGTALLGLGLQVAATGAVEPPAPALPALSAQQIVEKNVAARGGLATWKTVKAISYTGSMDAGRARVDNGMNPASRERPAEKPARPGAAPVAAKAPGAPSGEGIAVSLPFKMVLERPNHQRIEVKFKDETLVQVYDGKQGWKLQPYLKRGVQPFSPEELRQARQFQEIDGPLVNYTAKGTRLALDGTDVVDGRPAYRLKLTLKSGDVRRVWVDAQSFLDVQIDGTRHFNGHEVTEYTALRDYRDVAGVKVPFQMETRIEGMTERQKIVVEKAAINPKVDEALFRRPG
jgi:hypothetical protein